MNGRDWINTLLKGINNSVSSFIICKYESHHREIIQGDKYNVTY